jgi:glucose/arabinose dehydrogenase
MSIRLHHIGIGVMLAAMFSSNPGAIPEIGGHWVFSSQVAIGHDLAVIILEDTGTGIKGRYFGILGQDRPLSGTSSGEGVTLVLSGEWPPDGTPIEVTIAGSLSGDSGSGTLKVGTTVVGSWSARRPRPDENLTPHAKVRVDYRHEHPGKSRVITPTDLPAAGPALTLANARRTVPRPPDAWPQAPPGFEVSVYADGLDMPRKIVTAPNGDVFLSESRLGEIKVLRGVGGDGRASTTATFAAGLERPFGIAFYPVGSTPQYVYVATPGSVVRFPYANGDLIARGVAEIVIPDLPTGADVVGGGHWTRDLAFSLDGQTLFVSVGSFSNDDDSAREVRRANVLAYTPNGRFDRIFASGLRNPVGIAVEPGTGQLWCTVSERDLFGDDLVPDFITHLEPGGFYGWPWFYIGPQWDAKYQGIHPELKDSVVVPDVLLQAHSAPMTLTFYDGRLFPSSYQGDAFVALHGSWNRSVRTGYSVVRLDLDGSKSGAYEDFLTGFVTHDARPWGRPVGLTVTLDGALLVTDDASRVVWRVVYTGPIEVGRR